MHILNLDFLKSFPEITIIGHANADFDAILSGLLLEYGFNQMGISSKFRLQDNLEDAEFKKVSKMYNFKKELKKIENLSEPVFLVDFTGKYNNVVGCFDHHPPVCEIKHNYVYEDSSACAKLIYDYLEENHVEIPKIYQVLTVYACYLDTVSFSSTKARMKDKVWCQEKIKELGLNEKEIERLGYGITDISCSFEDYICNGMKPYTLSENREIMSSYIITEDVNFELDEAISILRQKLQDKYVAWLFIICDIVKKETSSVMITKNYSLVNKEPGILSRGQKLVPPLINFINFKNDGNLTSKLIEINKQISTMESCTSGLIASNITDYEGASSILKGSDITYSNEAKIKHGVPAKTINNYGVYSPETAVDMAKAIKEQYQSDISVGITGSFSNVDPNNADSVAGKVYFCINTNKNHIFELTYCNLNVSRKEIKQKTVDIVLATIDSVLSVSFKLD